MWSLTCVKAQVLGQVTGLGERLCTEMTGVRSLSTVGPHVSRQAARLRESFLAELAAEAHVLVSVFVHVSFQAAELCEALVAQLTDEGFIAGVGLSVTCQG